MCHKGFLTLKAHHHGHPSTETDDVNDSAVFEEKDPGDTVFLVGLGPKITCFMPVTGPRGGGSFVAVEPPLPRGGTENRGLCMAAHNHAWGEAGGAGKDAAGDHRAAKAHHSSHAGQRPLDGPFLRMGVSV